MVFAGLSSREQEIVKSAGTVRLVKHGQAILTEAESGRSLYVLLSGKAEVRKDLDDKNYRRLKDLGEGEVIGEMAFLGIAARSASVVANSDCSVLEITPEHFEQLKQDYPQICLTLYRNIACSMASRLMKTNDELKESLLVAIQVLDL